MQTLSNAIADRTPVCPTVADKHVAAGLANGNDVEKSWDAPVHTRVNVAVVEPAAHAPAA